MAGKKGYSISYRREESMISSRVIIFFLCILSIHAKAQDEIQKLENKAAFHQSALDSIFKALEVAKLQRVQQVIRSLAPPIKSGSQLIEHLAFSLSYNEEYEQADWVMHIITKD